MPDLHAMAMAIWEGAARIAILEARVAEQDGKIDTLQRLHEGLRHEIIDRHPAFPLPDPPANTTWLLDQSVPTSMSPPDSALPPVNATSLLLDQLVPASMSPPESALPPFIDLSMAGIEPTPPKCEDASAIQGVLFEHNQVVQPDHPDTSGNIVDPGDLSNLVPEYDSSNDMDVEVDVEVKVEGSSEEVDMAT
jgi:hypothetical protein